MANIIKYDPVDPIVANRVIAYIKSANSPDYETGNYLINPNLSAVSGVEQKYWKESSGDVVEMTSGEKADIDEYLAEQSESSDQYSDAEAQREKYWQMIGRLRRRVDDGDWSITLTEIEEFIEDLLKDSSNLYDNYLHGYDTEIKDFVTYYNVASFTTAIKTELNSLL